MPVTHVTGVRTIGVTRARERWICKYVSHPSQKGTDNACRALFFFLRDFRLRERDREPVPPGVDLRRMLFPP
jgi:hypothetical protein